ncbi:MAG TPA: DUF2089 domain-containing protein [Actinomycetota bacterium]|nr:DUF2089 domain-containing protein [Actinomycetota bacterium]
MPRALYPLITKDPASGSELVVTRLESLESGVVIEGRFSMGWIARLTPEQLDFVGLLLRSRNNLQKVATDLGVAYNTARSRLDDIVDALGGTPETERNLAREEVLGQLAAKEIEFDQAMEKLKRLGE